MRSVEGNETRRFDIEFDPFVGRPQVGFTFPVLLRVANRVCLEAAQLESSIQVPLLPQPVGDGSFGDLLHGARLLATELLLDAGSLQGGGSGRM